jgi:hypothetical protein
MTLSIIEVAVTYLGKGLLHVLSTTNTFSRYLYEVHVVTTTSKNVSVERGGQSCFSVVRV